MSDSKEAGINQAGSEQNGLDTSAYPRTVLGVLKSLPARALALIWKVVSFQGLVFLTATVLVWFGKIESYAWVLTCLVVLFGRAGLDFIQALKK